MTNSGRLQGLLGFGLCVLALSSPAMGGAIVYSGQAVDLEAMGFGHVPAILSVQSDPTEWGAVYWDGAADQLIGNATTPGSATMPVGALLAEGLTKKAFSIILNINEAVHRDVTIQSFTLDVYAPEGGDKVDDALFSAPLVGGPVTLPSAGHGQGQAGYLFFVFLSDSEWTTYFAGATDNRVGMSVPSGQPILDVSDGAESFTVAPIPIPEPATLLLLALGGLGLIRRRRP